MAAKDILGDKAQWGVIFRWENNFFSDASEHFFPRFID
jgi:hypothetical protein